jgi:hypothetical protein
MSSEVPPMRMSRPSLPLILCAARISLRKHPFPTHKRGQQDSKVPSTRSSLAMHLPAMHAPWPAAPHPSCDHMHEAAMACMRSV